MLPQTPSSPHAPRPQAASAAPSLPPAASAPAAGLLPGRLERSLLALFALTGACALVYQVAWVRMLGLVFGNVAQAVATVLAAFMGGLAAGSWLLGRLGDRCERPLRAYAALEAGIGLYALASPWLVAWLDGAFAGLQSWAGLSGGGLALARFAGAAALLALPTALMGGTLPVLSRRFAGDGGRASSVAAFYSANTWGAVAGVLAAAFALIPLLGVRGAVWAAGLANLAAAAAAFALGRTEAPLAVEPPMPAAGPALPRPGAAVRGSWLLLAGVAVNGLTCLACEVAWTRTLSMVFGPTVYSYAVMLAAVLCGIALGGLLAARFGERALALAGRLTRGDGQDRPGQDEGDRPALALLGFLQALLAAAALLAIPVLGALPYLFLVALDRVHGSFAGGQAAQLGLAFLALLAPATLSGAVLPVAGVWRAARNAPVVGAEVGGVYGASTLGAIAGSLLAGFALIPWLGLQATLTAVAVLNAALAACLLAAGLAASRRLRAAVLAGLAFFVVPYCMALPSWNRAVVAGGAFRHFADLASLVRAGDRGAVERGLGEGELLFYREGVEATITVRRDPSGVTSMAINGKPDASDDRFTDMPTQVLSGHLPLLLRAGARRVLVIGLASGVTVLAAARHPVEEIDCVEIEPAVVEASRFFGHVNKAAPWKDPRVKVIVGDARSYLKTTAKAYDAIISVPSNPWTPGSGALFTREFFELAKSRLAPGGVFGFWVQSYERPVEDYRSAARTALSVFPHLSLWTTNSGDTLFTATPEPLSIPYRDFAADASALAQDLGPLGIRDGLDLLVRFTASGGALRDLAGQGPLNTDDRPSMEFGTARFVRDQGLLRRNQRFIAGFSQTVAPYLTGFDQERDLARRYFSMGRYRQAEGQFLRLKPEPETLVDLGEAVLRQGRLDDARVWFEKAAEAAARAGDPVSKAKALAGLGLAALEARDWDAALEWGARALQAAPRLGQAFDLKAEALLGLGRTPEALEVYARCMKADPKYVRAYLAVARVELDLRNLPPAALEPLRKALELEPDLAEARFLMGKALHRLGFEQGAADNFRRALAADPSFERAIRAELGAGGLQARGEQEEAGRDGAAEAPLLPGQGKALGIGPKGR